VTIICLFFAKKNTRRCKRYADTSNPAADTRSQAGFEYINPAHEFEVHAIVWRNKSNQCLKNKSNHCLKRKKKQYCLTIRLSFNHRGSVTPQIHVDRRNPHPRGDLPFCMFRLKRRERREEEGLHTYHWPTHIALVVIDSRDKSVQIRAHRHARIL